MKVEHECRGYNVQKLVLRVRLWVFYHLLCNGQLTLPPPPPSPSPPLQVLQYDAKMTAEAARVRSRLDACQAAVTQQIVDT